MNLTNMDSKLKLSILGITILAFIIHESKPSLFYDDFDEFKKFGLNKSKNETILPLWLALFLIGIMIYSYQVYTEGKII